jgi:hypothetical protein
MVPSPSRVQRAEKLDPEAMIPDRLHSFWTLDRETKKSLIDALFCPDVSERSVHFAADA